ncbi:sigma-70 family RNA polymerase sigma factor [Marinilongibacter aquaticus]|uniref:RNA polymerase sigma factor n=1 Tax=Marinilongibacter aquaticus TaxID=2975157 RepID=UPI0021BDD40C|nr:sigma-70 family RNA polymerase sigma factor [Marinilongibacter aquaticus]UBM59386.1 sigma-70 family RNA polymerase sigma factor [Marinilongibacter aquaticus]
MNKKQRTVAENEVLLDFWHKSKSGDSGAFCLLADRLYRSLFNYAVNFTNDREVAKDAIQDLLLHIWERRQSIQIQYVTIYFLKALRNQLLQEFRKAGNADVFLDIEAVHFLTDHVNIETELEEREAFFDNKKRVQSALEVLPKRQKEAVFLKFYKGLENEQIAELMQVNRQSVANLLYKAINTLRSQVPAFQSLWLILIGLDCL